MKLQICSLAKFAKTDGNSALQHIPIHPCNTPRATKTGGSKMLMSSTKGAPRMIHEIFIKANAKVIYHAFM